MCLSLEWQHCRTKNKELQDRGPREARRQGLPSIAVVSEALPLWHHFFVTNTAHQKPSLTHIHVIVIWSYFSFRLAKSLIALFLRNGGGEAYYILEILKWLFHHSAKVVSITFCKLLSGLLSKTVFSLAFHTFNKLCALCVLAVTMVNAIVLPFKALTVRMGREICIKTMIIQQDKCQ